MDGLLQQPGAWRVGAGTRLQVKHLRDSSQYTPKTPGSQQTATRLILRVASDSTISANVETGTQFARPDGILTKEHEPVVFFPFNEESSTCGLYVASVLSTQGLFSLGERETGGMIGKGWDYHKRH